MSKSKLLDKIGQFTTIPNSIIELWPAIGIDGMALFVYLRYRTNGQTGDAFPSYDRITSDTLLTRRRIAQAIRQLESAGLIERKRRFSASTIYTLKIPDSISTDAELIEPTISTHAGLPLVHHLHANQIENNKIENNTSPNGETAPAIEEPNHRKRTDRDIAVDELESKFSALSRLQKPDRKKKKSSGPTLWWNPLQTMWELCDKDTGQAWKLIEAAYNKLIEAQMTVSSPKSLLNTAIALHANGNGRKGITVRC